MATLALVFIAFAVPTNSSIGVASGSIGDYIGDTGVGRLVAPPFFAKFEVGQSGAIARRAALTKPVETSFPDGAELAVVTTLSVLFRSNATSFLGFVAYAIVALVAESGTIYLFAGAHPIQTHIAFSAEESIVTLRSVFFRFCDARAAVIFDATGVITGVCDR